MQNFQTTPQENFPLAVFDTHVLKDRVFFTLPMQATLEALIPLAKELLHLGPGRNMEANIEVSEGGELVISISSTSD